jgi:hypothetical protein
MVNYKNGWIIKRGQKHITSNHEKGSRHKNREAQKEAAIKEAAIAFWQTTRTRRGSTCWEIDIPYRDLSRSLPLK